jgi:hypothetical protein
MLGVSKRLLHLVKPVTFYIRCTKSRSVFMLYKVRIHRYEASIIFRFLSIFENKKHNLLVFIVFF